MSDPQERFRTYLDSIAPRWGRKGRWGELWATIGLGFDAFADAAKDAVKARFVNLAPLDALGFIGADRLLERYPVQSDASWRAWLEAAWDLWTFAGTHTSVERALHEAGFTNASVHWALGTAPDDYVGTWPPDGDTANWSRFWVWLGDVWPLGWTVVNYGDGHTWGSYWTWGSTATVEEINFVRAICRKWKAGHTVCAGIYVPITGSTTLTWSGTP